MPVEASVPCLREKILYATVECCVSPRGIEEMSS